MIWERERNTTLRFPSKKCTRGYIFAVVVEFLSFFYKNY